MHVVCCTAIYYPDIWILINGIICHCFESEHGISEEWCFPHWCLVLDIAAILKLLSISTMQREEEYNSSQHQHQHLQPSTSIGAAFLGNSAHIIPKKPNLNTLVTALERLLGFRQ